MITETISYVALQIAPDNPYAEHEIGSAAFNNGE